MVVKNCGGQGRSHWIIPSNSIFFMIFCFGSVPAECYYLYTLLEYFSAVNFLTNIKVDHKWKCLQDEYLSCPGWGYRGERSSEQPRSWLQECKECRLNHTVSDNQFIWNTWMKACWSNIFVVSFSERSVKDIWVACFSESRALRVF